jgi:hypothetical protein
MKKKTFNKTLIAIWLVTVFFVSCEEYTLPRDGDWMGELVTEEEEDDGSFVRIKFNIPSEYSMTVGNKVWLEVTVTGDIVRTPEFLWLVNGAELARDTTKILFEGTSPGVNDIVFRVTAENGTAEKALLVTVQERPVSNTLFYFDYGKWRNENTPAVQTYTVPQERKLIISPVRHFRQLTDTTRYEWALDGVIQTQDVLFPCYFEYTADGEPGDIHTVTVYARDSNRYDRYAASAETKIRIVPPEGTYRRPSSPASGAVATKVHEFTPAPGQFIRGNGTGFPPVIFAPGITEQDVAAQTEEYMNSAAFMPNFDEGGAVSLGSWGGYLVTGFDHSVENRPGQYSFSIEGNPLGNYWSEPGIVWVSQDENGDGLANDTWFELRASETGRDGTVQLYSVTYYKPDPARGCVWEDNMGDSGVFPYRTFHLLPIGYPYQTGSDSVTFTGTSILSHVFFGALIASYSYPFGYVDNKDKIEHFRISDAMQIDGAPVNLAYIDFVKVQCAVLKWAGGLGEISTELGLPVDYLMTH